jgi:hypothetical protein
VSKIRIPGSKTVESTDFSAGTQKKFNWSPVIPTFEASHRTAVAAAPNA